MKRDTIRERAREEQSTERAFTAAKLRQLLATFFLCQQDCIYTQCKIRKKKSNKTQILSDLHFKGQLNHVQAGVLLGTTSTCRIVTLTNFPLSSKMNVYPTGRVDTKYIKETSEERLMGALKKHVNHTGAYRKKCTRFSFFRQTQLLVQMFYNMNI